MQIFSLKCGGGGGLFFKSRFPFSKSHHLCLKFSRVNIFRNNCSFFLIKGRAYFVPNFILFKAFLIFLEINPGGCLEDMFKKTCYCMYAKGYYNSSCSQRNSLSSLKDLWFSENARRGTGFWNIENIKMFILMSHFICNSVIYHLKYALF